MSDLLFYLGLIIGIVMVIAGLVGKKVPPPPPPRILENAFDLTAKLKKGQLNVCILIRFVEGMTPLFEIRRIVNEWAIALDDFEDESGLYALLNARLQAEVPGFSPKVISIEATNRPPKEPPKVEKPIEKQPTQAERLVAYLDERIECADALTNRLTTLEQERPDLAKLFVKGVSVQERTRRLVQEETDGLDGYVERQILGVFHERDRIR